MNPSDDPPVASGHLGLWDTVSIILGIVIGAGIYETAPFVFQNVPNASVALGVWVAGGFLSLVGALCYAELASAYPKSGGDYVYLREAFGRGAAFMFGWCQLTVLMTGSIGMMAYIFADYAARLWHVNSAIKPLLAAGAVVFFSITCILGVVMGRRAQNVLTWAKVIGIGGILVAGFSWGAHHAGAPVTNTTQGAGSIGLAMVLVLYTYGGWNDAALVASEIRDRKRNIPRALVFGTLLLSLIYVLMNAAYLAGLGFEGARNSKQIAADLLESRIGSTGAAAISVLVVISALGAVNGLIYTGSRIYSSMGSDFRLFSGLSRYSKRGSPVASLVWQCLMALALILLVGTSIGRGAINGVLSSAGFGAISWDGHGGFDTLLRCTAPVFWLFFLATGISLFVLRKRQAERHRPFYVPLYPVLPLIFCGTCVYMLYSATVYAGKLLLIGLIPFLLGGITYLLTRNSARIVRPLSPQIKQETIP